MFSFKKKQTTVVRELKSISYDIDIVFLNKLINHKIDFFFKYKIEVMHDISNYRLSDRHIKPIVSQIIDEVLKSISDEYRKILLRYFSEVGLIDYISENIIITVNENYKKVNSKEKVKSQLEQSNS